MSVVEGFGETGSDAESVGTATPEVVPDGSTPLDAESVGVAAFVAPVEGACDVDGVVALSVGNGVAPVDAVVADGLELSLTDGVAESLTDAESDGVADALSVGVADPESVGTGIVVPPDVGIGDDEPGDTDVAIGEAESVGSTPVALEDGNGVADGRTMSGPFASMMSSSSAMSTVI